MFTIYFTTLGRGVSIQPGPHVLNHSLSLLEDLAEHGGLPKFIVREFEEYLRYGLLSAGCLHLQRIVANFHRPRS